jgi:hypothetical protein
MVKIYTSNVCSSIVTLSPFATFEDDISVKRPESVIANSIELIMLRIKGIKIRPIKNQTQGAVVEDSAISLLPQTAIFLLS